MDDFARSPLQVRTAFLSDVHLGARECRIDLVHAFLCSVQCEQLVLVGDIIDLWSLKRSHFWPAQHNAVVQLLMARARAGLRIIYVPGNHDETFRDYCGARFGSLEVHRQYEHVTAAGRRMLVIHGDEFDTSVGCSRWLAAMGTVAYDVALSLNRGWNRIRNACGYPYWSLAGYLKSHIGKAVRYVEQFEQAAAHHAARLGYDGIICGHIHRPAQRRLLGIDYCNTGDWVDSCTALVEDASGALRLLSVNDWLGARGAQPARLRAA